jgi:aldose 1-epimerase
MKNPFPFLLLLLPAAVAQDVPAPAGEGRQGPFRWKEEKDAASGLSSWQLRYENTKEPRLNLSIRVCPEAGANLYSMVLGETELLHVPADLTGLHRGGTGTPILYPTPNRVRNGRFAFEGREFKFSDDGKTTIHGLVLKAPWKSETPKPDDDGVTLKTWIDFEPGAPAYDRFPFKHRLGVEYRLSSRAVRIRFTVDNRDDRKLPFGFALHPYFRVLGPRDQTFLRVPAQSRMEATPDLLPTGTLQPLEGAPFDLRRPRPLSELALDDVYWGVKPEEAPGYEARDTGVRVDLPASEHFTHMVVYTPKGRPFFCMENQTCSTDAHNLHSRGLAKEAHLLVVEPGQSMSGWVEFRPSWIRW